MSYPPCSCRPLLACAWRLGLHLLLILGLLAGVRPAHAGTAAVLRATLDNGLQVVIVPNPLAAAVTTVINYRVGSNDAPPGFPGMAHATEHMMFRGSQGLSAEQLAQIASAMGGDFNADTQQTVTQYFFTVPAEDLDLALRIEAIRMRGLLSTAALWQHERSAIEQEVAQDLSSPDYISYTRLLAALFKGTPYAYDALGSRASFELTTAAMLKQFHTNWYVPNNAILVIVGNIDPRAALKQVRKLFGTIPRKPLPPRTPVKLQAVTAATLHLDTDQAQGLAMIAFRMPGYDSRDYAAAQVLADVLSSQRGDLFDLVVQGKALDAGFNLNAYAPAGIGYAAVAYPSGADTNSLLEAMRNILQHKIAHGFSPELVEAARRRELAAAESEKNSIAGLAMLWSQALAVEGRDSPEDDLTALKRVTPADVQRVAQLYLDFEHAVTVVLAPTSSGKPVAAKGFGGRESFTPDKIKPVALPAWADKVLQRISIPQSSVHPSDTLLANGIRLIVQPTDVSDTVSVYGHIRNRPELEEPPGQEGVHQVLEQLFGYGTTTLDRRAFQKALDDIAADEGAGTDFSLQVLREHFERGVELLADNELHPALPASAFAVVKQQIVASIAGRNTSPDYLMGRAVRAALYTAHDPTLRQSTSKSVSALQLDDVRNYFQRVYRPDLTTIVVIGRVTPAQARASIEKYFGGWQTHGAKPDILLPPVAPNKATVTAVPNNSRVQDKAILIETLALKRNDPDYYALQLGNHVLGGGFYSTRLYRDLRENSGLVYYVSSDFDIGKTRAIYQVNYACDPPNVARVRAIIEHNLQVMQSTPVSVTELHNAQASLLRAIPLAEASVDSIAAGLLDRANYELPLDEPLRAARQYTQLTAGAVKAAFAKWLRPQDLAQVTQGPTPR